MFLDGEADMVLSYTTSPPITLIAENKPQYRAAAFEEGTTARWKWRPSSGRHTGQTG